MPAEILAFKFVSFAVAVLAVIKRRIAKKQEVLKQAVTKDELIFSFYSTRSLLKIFAESRITVYPPLCLYLKTGAIFFQICWVKAYFFMTRFKKKEYSQHTPIVRADTSIAGGEFRL